MSGPRYHAPDRSSFRPNTYRKDPDLPEGDLGAYMGEFVDGRPYRVESWYTEGLTLITCFFCVDDLESTSPEQLLEYIRPVLEETKVPDVHRKLSASDVRTMEDASGHRLFSLTFVVGRPD